MSREQQSYDRAAALFHNRERSSDNIERIHIKRKPRKRPTGSEKTLDLEGWSEMPDVDAINSVVVALDRQGAVRMDL